MEALYTTEPSNQYLTLVLEEAEEWRMLENSINRCSLARSWTPLRFRFEGVGKAAILTPTICTVYLPGVLALRSELRKVLFPAPCDELEFLPIEVGEESWLLLNCLKSTDGYDARESAVMRGANGEAFLIQRIVVDDESVRVCGVFTIADSNRGQLVVLASVKDCIVTSGARGIEFREIGLLRSPPAPSNRVAK
jgi:hypothetical protein